MGEVAICSHSAGPGGDPLEPPDGLRPHSFVTGPGPAGRGDPPGTPRWPQAPFLRHGARARPGPRAGCRGRQQAGRDLRWHRQYHAVGPDHLAVAVAPGSAAAGQADQESPGGQRLHRGHLGAQPDPGAQPAEQAGRGLPVQVTERHRGDPDVRRVPAGQQGGLHHGGGERQVRVIPGDVERGDREQVPQCPPGMFALPVGGQPVTEALPVKLGAGRVEPGHGEGGGYHAQSFGIRKVLVAGQCLAHVQRAGERRAAQPGTPAWAQHGDVEPVLERHRAGHAEPGQQATVGGAAAQEHVLPVVHGQAAAAERAGGAAQARPGFEQRDPGPRLGERDGGGDAGQPATHHHHVRRGCLCGHRAAPGAAAGGRGRRRGGRTAAAASDLTATAAFSPADSETRRLSTAAGVAAMCSSRR